MLTLELAVHDALHRIKTAYDKTDGKIYLSFSGGKDSTIVAELIKMAELPTKIPFVFADTGIELGATERFVKAYDYDNVVYVKPVKRMQQVIKDYGVPAMSKVKSQFIGTWQRQVSLGNDPLDTVSCTRLLGTTGNGADRLANKHLHFIHKDHEYKVANQCCNYMKKKPFSKFEEDTEYKNVFTGVRIAEGGIRATQYKSCVLMRKKGKREQLVSMPIIDWTDEICDEFVKTYNVKLSDAYEVYGFTRTGCVGCPFGTNELVDTLPTLQQYEPLKYKATMHFFKKVYMDLGVELPNDPVYMSEYKQRQIVVQQRNKEMMLKYRPDTKTAKKYQQLSLFEEEE